MNLVQGILRSIFFLHCAAYKTEFFCWISHWGSSELKKVCACVCMSLGSAIILSFRKLKNFETSIKCSFCTFTTVCISNDCLKRVNHETKWFLHCEASSFSFKICGGFAKLKGREKFCDHSWERCDLADFGSFFALCFQVSHMNQMPSLLSWFCTFYKLPTWFWKKGC